MSARPRLVALFFLAALAAFATLAPTGLAASPDAVPASSSASPSTSTASSKSSGALEGEVTLGPRLTARRMRFNAYPDAQAAIAAKPAHTDPSRVEEFANVVVFLEPTDGPELRKTSKRSKTGSEDDVKTARVSASRPAPAGTFAIRQNGLAFEPHVLPVVKGATVEFPNADTVFHNVFSLSRASTFDLGRYPRGESKSVRFDAPGLVKVFCHIHSDMSAVVLVLDNPYFAVPDASGHFRLDGVPPGEYRAVAWHERARRVSQTIRITPGGTVQASFQIPLEDPVE
ncbi:MAG TPA: plastocyanin/azurin family copper-binding protein [Candidatus Polarisedimenticolia bacterium]|nr:plastocyanin/azurin family copper-binding protein [Candidatus Polarisedimenticolia bacterium]